MSHGLIAILTGGNLDQITLYKTGEGQCHYTGGYQALVTFSGYLGAVLWGMFIYLGALSSIRTAHQFGVGLSIFVGLSGVLWARDFNTWIILIAIILMLLISLMLVQRKPVQLFVQFIGIFVLVNGIKSLLELLAIPNKGDHVELAHLTSYSKNIWLIIWLFCASLALIYLWRRSAKLN